MNPIVDLLLLNGLINGDVELWIVWNAGDKGLVGIGDPVLCDNGEIGRSIGDVTLFIAAELTEGLLGSGGRGVNLRASESGTVAILLELITGAINKINL